jgi:rhodanese-related sulfurtransferase
MATKNRSRRANGGSTKTATTASTRPSGSTGGRGATKAPTSRPSRTWLLVGSGALVAVLAVVVGWGVLSNGSGAGSGAAAAGTTGGPANGTVIQANGGQWTNITPDTLAGMMTRKDFTLLNVKTPYIGEIQGTDLYIPYTELATRAAELPSDKSAPIVVYCRTGNESAIAAQTLLDLGYTNIENLAGGMTAWTASGRPIVQLYRS